MNLSGCHFNYSNTSSRMYNLCFAHFNTTEYLPIAGSIKTETFYNPKSKQNYIISDSYESGAISFEAEIITDDAVPIEQEYIKNVERWLFKYRDYQMLYVDLEDDCDGESYEIVDGELKRIHLYCRFVNPEKIYGNGGLVGWKVNVECNSPFAFQDVTEKRFRVPSDSGLIEVPVDSDMDDYIYPRVTIRMGYSGGDVSIENTADMVGLERRITEFKSVPGNATIHMNGELNLLDGVEFSKFVGRNFIRFLPNYNYIKVTGDVDYIEFSWENRRYL